jgi:transposase
MTKPDARKLPPKAQEDLRRRVVAAVRGGMGKTEAARTFGVTRQSIHNWMSAIEQGGAAALRARTRGPKPGSTMLAPHQAATVVRMVTASCPDQLRLPFALWTREAVCALVKRRFGVDMSVWTAGRYLAAWGLTPQKPLRRAYERDEAAVRKWLEEEYPSIAARAKRERAEIHWGDQMGLRSDHQTGTSYAKRGVTPVIPGTGQRFRCNMISTVTNRGSLAFMVFTESFTAPVMVRFLKRLTRHAGRRVFLIVDGHPVHRSARVKSWVRVNAAKIELFLLPPYSPDLNPDEFLNQDVKSNALGRRRPRDRHEMVAGVRGYLRSTQRRPDIVKRYFHAESVRYAA